MDEMLPTDQKMSRVRTRRTAPAVQHSPLSDLEQLIQSFLQYVEYDKGYSPETITKYRSNLKRFAREVPIDDITTLAHDHLTDWKMQMYDHGASRMLVHNLLYTLRSFLGYCVKREQLVVLDPLTVELPKIPEKVTRVPTPEEQRAFLAAIEEDALRGDRYAIRFKALVYCLRATGCRISEMLSINREDIDWEEREVIIRGKGDRERIVYFDEDALTALRSYLDMRVDTCPALFVANGKPPKRLHRSETQRYFNRYTKRSVIRTNITAHSWRRVFCTTLHKNGADILDVKELAGHRDVKTTMKYYIGRDPEKLKKRHRRFLKFGYDEDGTQ